MTRDMNRYKAIAALLCAAALTACDYEKNAVQDLTAVAPVAGVKFFNFGVNAPGVNFYANDTKMTAVLSASGTEAVTGTTYSSVGAGGFYSAITPGSYTLSGKIAAATDKDLAISTVTAAISDAKYYSFYLSGFYNTATKSVEGFVIEDPFPATIVYGVASVRFVNAISNSAPMTMFAKHTTTGVEVPIGGSVAYKSGSAFIAVPNGVYDLNTRVTGSAANVITRTGVSLLAGRVHTIGARGDITIVSTTATNRPFLDNTLNR